MIRMMDQRDLGQVLNIERSSFDDPRTPQEFETMLHARNIISFVSERYSAIDGFAVAVFYHDSIWVDSVAVAPAFRCRHIGKDLITRVLSMLRGKRRTVRVWVPDRNYRAVHFFQSLGFVVTGSDCRDDVPCYRLRYDVGPVRSWSPENRITSRGHGVM